MIQVGRRHYYLSPGCKRRARNPVELLQPRDFCNLKYAQMFFFSERLTLCRELFVDEFGIRLIVHGGCSPAKLLSATTTQSQQVIVSAIARKIN